MATSMFTKAPRAGRMQRMSGAPRCRASVTAIVAARATSSRPVDRVAPATRLPRAAALALALVSSACSGPGPHQAPGPGSISPPFDPTELPQPPRPISLTGRDPTAVAAELVAATADALPDVSPGWLAAYAAFGVPVTDSRTGQRPADPVGPRWAQVWSVGQTSRGKVRVPLADVARSLAGGFGDPVSGDVVLADLRAGATSGNAATQTLARFVAAKSLAAGGTDPLDQIGRAHV